MKNRLRVFLSGQRSFGSSVLTMLLESKIVDVVGVSCPPLSDKGTTDSLWFTSSQNNIHIIPSGMLNAESLPKDIDLIICAHSHDFIGKRTRLNSRLGAIGYHPSLLPLHRGRDAIAWTIRFKDKITGGSVYWLNDRTDGGDIAAQDWCFVRPEDTASSLWRRELFPMGVKLIEQVIRDLRNGIMVAVPQDDSLSSWEPSIGRPPLHRPDLPLIGTTLSNFKVVRERENLKR